MLRSALLSAPLSLALSACQSEAPARVPPPPQPPEEDACGASRLGRFVGKESSLVMAEIASSAAGRPIRTVRPGDAVTMDHRPDRLNVELDTRGRITRLRCG